MRIATAVENLDGIDHRHIDLLEAVTAHWMWQHCDTRLFPDIEEDFITAVRLACFFDEQADDVPVFRRVFNRWDDPHTVFLLKRNSFPVRQ
jgi:hypothetical protein